MAAHGTSSESTITTRGEPVAPDPGDVVVRMAGVGVRRGDTTLLAGVDWTVELDERWVVLGPNGAGKTTLLGLVSRLVEPTAGEVLVDGQPLAATTPRSTFRKIGVAGPDLPLLRGTVRRNLTYSRPDVDPAEVARVLYATGLDEVVATLPQGLATPVVEGGRNLAAGQRQLVALARALLGNPPILLLDQPSTHLDAAAKERFRRLLARHHGTVLLVTADPEEIALADQVWELDRGRVVAVHDGADHRERAWTAAQATVRNSTDEEGTSWTPAAQH